MRYNGGHIFNGNGGNVTVCGKKYAQVGLFLSCYNWKCFLARSVAFLGKLSHQYSSRSLESWPCFVLCFTTTSHLQICTGKFYMYTPCFISKKSWVTLPLEEDFLPESSVGMKCCHSMLLIFVCIVIRGLFFSACKWVFDNNRSIVF